VPRSEGVTKLLAGSELKSKLENRASFRPGSDHTVRVGDAEGSRKCTRDTVKVSPPILAVAGVAPPAAGQIRVGELSQGLPPGNRGLRVTDRIWPREQAKIYT